MPVPLPICVSELINFSVLRFSHTILLVIFKNKYLCHPTVFSCKHMLTISYNPPLLVIKHSQIVDQVFPRARIMCFSLSYATCFLIPAMFSSHHLTPQIVITFKHFQLILSRQTLFMPISFLKPKPHTCFGFVLLSQLTMCNLFLPSKSPQMNFRWICWISFWKLLGTILLIIE